MNDLIEQMTSDFPSFIRWRVELTTYTTKSAARELLTTMMRPNWFNDHKGTNEIAHYQGIDDGRWEVTLDPIEGESLDDPNGATARITACLLRVFPEGQVTPPTVCVEFD